MPVTLSWLLDRDDLALRLVDDRVDAAGVVIDWVHSIELQDPTPWLQGGELVLSTGLRLPRARAEQTAYVRLLAGADVAALAFGTGVRFDSIPNALRVACAEQGLPLVEVPLPTPFVAVTRAIADRLAELHYESMERTMRFQRRLTAAALRDGTRGVVRGLAAELSAGVLVLDERHRPVESARTTAELAQRLGTELDRRTDTRRTSLHLVEDDRSIEVHSVGGRSGTSGWLAVDSATPLSNAQRVPLNQALSLLTLQRDRSADLLDLRRRVGATVLDLLLEPPVLVSDRCGPSGAVATPAKDPKRGRGAEHLRGFGFDTGDPVVVLVARAGPDSPPPDGATAGLDALGLGYVATVRDDALVVLVRAADADAFAERLAAGAATVGLSGALAQSDIPAALAQAGSAATSAYWRREPVGRHDGLPLARVLDDRAVRERVAGLTEAALTPLRDHTVLLESLQTFLRTNGSWETASRALGVHRHTLRNRMTRVEELTGLSLDQAEDRAVLLLGLMAR